MNHEELLKKLKNLSLNLNFYKINLYREEDFDKTSCHCNVFVQLKSDEEPSENDFLEIPYTNSGDYISFSCVSNMSNYRILAEEFDDIIQVYGDYSYETLFIQLSDLTKEENQNLIDIIEQLSNYPILDENDEYQLIEELAEKAWDNWVKHDFKKELYQYFDEDEYDLDTFNLKSIFYQFIEITGDWFETEGNDVIIRVEDIVKKMYEDSNEDFWEILINEKNN